MRAMPAASSASRPAVFFDRDGTINADKGYTYRPADLVFLPGAVAVRSRGKFAEISMRDWEPAGAGGESGYTAGDVLHPGIIFGGTGERFNLEQNRPVPGVTAPKPPEKARYMNEMTLDQAWDLARPKRPGSDARI